MDPLGNWDETVLDSVTESRVHNSVNELTARTVGQDPQISLTYDDAGNLTQDGSADGDHQYVWDYRNRLIEVKEYQTDTWNTTAEYKYDARNRRILKVVTNKGDFNGTTRFLWGGESAWQCFEERNGDGDLVARSTYAPGYIDDVAVQERDLNDDQDFADAGEVAYYHQNTLFSVYALTDASETVAERYRYNAYGGCTVLDANGSVDADGLSDVGNPYTFTGRRLDLESGLMQYRNRYYSPALGRFISRDPEGYVDGPNLLSYGGGRPTSARDPMGTQHCPDYPRAPIVAMVAGPLPITECAALKDTYELCQIYDDVERRRGDCQNPRIAAHCFACNGPGRETFLSRCETCCDEVFRPGKRRNPNSPLKKPLDSGGIITVARERIAQNVDAQAKRAAAAGPVGSHR
ncbi:MAG: RHS repeat-associated core domain-containing protein, partial [Phycisphaerae bacterium]|nr:RHS repeat-associated core domain-containing protein [Phycisphaerae bacterium]